MKISSCLDGPFQGYVCEVECPAVGAGGGDGVTAEGAAVEKHDGDDFESEPICEAQTDAGEAAEAPVDEAMQAEETKVLHPCKKLNSKIKFHFPHLVHIGGNQRSDVQERASQCVQFALC